MIPSQIVVNVSRSQNAIQGPNAWSKLFAHIWDWHTKRCSKFWLLDCFIRDFKDRPELSNHTCPKNLYLLKSKTRSSNRTFRSLNFTLDLKAFLYNTAPENLCADNIHHLIKVPNAKCRRSSARTKYWYRLFGSTRSKVYWWPRHVNCFFKKIMDWVSSIVTNTWRVRASWG